MGSGGGQVDVVIAGSGAHHNLQLLGGVEHFGIHLVRADNQRIGILYGIQQLLLLGVFLQQGQLISCSLYLFLDAFHGSCCERLLCCY